METSVSRALVVTVAGSLTLALGIIGLIWGPRIQRFYLDYYMRHPPRWEWQRGMYTRSVKALQSRLASFWIRSASAFAVLMGGLLIIASVDTLFSLH